MKVRSGSDVPDLISVIITTYEREDALDAVLAALSRQGDRGFEVVIADDGSGPGTADLVERWRSRLGVALRHVWQKNCGFRAAEIRNRALLACQGDYCVFLDGDCLAPPDFIATHRKLAEPGWFVTGNRVLLSPALTAAVLRDGLHPEAWNLSRWLGHRKRGGVNRLAGVLRLPLGPLLHCGLRRKYGRFATGVIHLWHAQADRAQLAANDARLDAVLHSDHTRAQRGLSVLRAMAGENDREDDHHAATQS